MDKIKVLFFSVNLKSKDEFKGTGNWVISLLTALKENREFIFTFAFHDNNVNKIEYEKYGNMQLVRIPLLYDSNKFHSALSNWLLLDKYKNATKYYLEIINQTKPDLIQIFGLESPFIRIIDKVKQPLLIHIQGLIAPYIFKFFPRFNSYEILKSKKFRNILSGNIPLNIKREWYKHLKIENQIYRNIKYCMGRTDWDRRFIKAVAPNAKYFYCQEIMREPFYNVNWVPSKNAEYILYTTITDNFYKNVDMIYETCIVLEKYSNNLNFKWRVGGVTYNDITPKIMSKKKINPQNLYLLGKLGAKEIVRELLNANVFVFPSAIENSPNAVEEAMLLGIPIIATYAGGLSTIIDNNETGILVNEGDPYVLAGAIIEIIENYNEAIARGKNARKVALNRHNPQKVVNGLLDIYKVILDE